MRSMRLGVSGPVCQGQCVRASVYQGQCVSGPVCIWAMVYLGHGGLVYLGHGGLVYLGHATLGTPVRAPCCTTQYATAGLHRGCHARTHIDSYWIPIYHLLLIVSASLMDLSDDGLLTVIDCY